MASRAEKVRTLLSRVFEEQGAIYAVGDLRDFAMEAEEDDENPVKPTYKEVRAFSNDKGRNQVFMQVKQEWPSRIRKPTQPGIHSATDGLDRKTQAPQKEQPGHEEQEATN